MGNQPLLTGFGQVMRQQQNAVGAGTLGLLCALDGKTRGTTGTGNDRHLAAAGVHCCFDDFRVLVTSQRKELAGTTGGKQGCGAIRGQPFQALDVAFPVEVTVGIEVGQRERQQAVGHDGFEFLGIHLKGSL